MMILYFYTDNALCKQMDEVLEDAGCDVYRISATKNLTEVDRYNICTTPTLIFIDKDGEETGRMVPTTPIKVKRY